MDTSLPIRRTLPQPLHSGILGAGNAHPNVRGSITRAMTLATAISLIVAAVWMGVGAWYGVRAEEEGWTKVGANSLEVTLDHFKAESRLLARVATSNPHALSDWMMPGDLLLEENRGTFRVVLPPHALIDAATARTLGRLAQDSYLIRSRRLFFAASNPSGKDGGRIILLRGLRQKDLDSVLAETGTEAVVLSDVGHPLGTFRNMKGSLVEAAFPASLWPRLTDGAWDDLLLTSVRISIPDYAGFRGIYGVYDAGSSPVDTVGSFFPIRDATSNPIAYGGSLVDRKALSAVMIRSFKGALLLLGLLCTLSFLFAQHLAGRLLSPLSEEIHRIYSLGRRIALDEDLASDGKPTAGELEMLRQAVSQVERAVERDKKMSAELQEERARSMFSAKMATLGEMASGVAHEINTPLAVISSRADQLKELLAERPLDLATAQKVSQSIPVTVQRIARIVQGLRAFAREGSHEEPRAVAVDQLLEEVLSLCNERFRLHSVRLDLPQLHEGLTALCRPTEILQVLLNLLNNAFDAVQELPERWVRVDAGVQDGHVRIAITDSGNGISLELADKIFQPFFTTKGPGRGTGLGLSISRSIAQSNGGSLVLEHGLHTRFALRLPLAQGSRESRP